MKRFENIFRTIFLALFLIIASQAVYAQEDSLSEADNIEIGLITCSPHEEIYSLYGHTALRCHNLRTGEDFVYNYGIFNFSAPHFMLRFVFGLTDYELGRAPTRPFCNYYREWGSQVTEHVLNLTRAEKMRILDALLTNYRPENRTYRYNFFYNNCSTRPRDIIEGHLDGKIVYHPRTDYEPTYREMLHSHNAHHSWTTFGIDLLLGINADRKTTMRQQEFLPENLRYDFDHADIDRGGQQVPLIKERRQLVKPGIQLVEQDFPLSPMSCALLLLGISLIIFGFEYVKKTTLRLFDIMLMLLTGLAGIVLTVMIFSEHPATSLNLQFLILNPLALLFLWKVWKGRKTIWFKFHIILTVLFLLGSIWQDYAEGMEILALCLLLRDLRHYNDK